LNKCGKPVILEEMVVCKDKCGKPLVDKCGDPVIKKVCKPVYHEIEYIDVPRGFWQETPITAANRMLAEHGVSGEYLLQEVEKGLHSVQRNGRIESEHIDFMASVFESKAGTAMMSEVAPMMAQAAAV
jgi:hypothetical protein